MDNKLLLSVKKMHEKFDLQNNAGPQRLTEEEKKFRIVALREEISEYEESTELVDEYDALIDLLVFTVGTFERQGFNLQDGFDAVMQCNMQKNLAGSDANSKRGFKRDLVKPEGWIGPEPRLQSILDNVKNMPHILTERGSTHGNFSESSVFNQAMLDLFRNTKNWNDMPAMHKESIEMIMHKIGRIVFGNFNFKDHWVDIAGYATLVENEIKE